MQTSKPPDEKANGLAVSCLQLYAGSNLLNVLPLMQALLVVFRFRCSTPSLCRHTIGSAVGVIVLVILLLGVMPLSEHMA
jgi:hypothetical protein